MIDENGCIVFSPRTKACPSWPVRIAGIQGLWRYIGPMLPADMEVSSVSHVDVIGPYFPGNSARNGGRSRIVRIEDVRYAGKHTKPIDVISVETKALSQEAQRARRR